MKKDTTWIKLTISGLLTIFTIVWIFKSVKLGDTTATKILVLCSAAYFTYFATHLLWAITDEPEFSPAYRLDRVYSLHVLNSKESFSYYGLIIIESLIRLIFVIAIYQLVFTFVYNHSNILFVPLWIGLYMLHSCVKKEEENILKDVKSRVISIYQENQKVNGESIVSKTLYDELKKRLPEHQHEKLDAVIQNKEFSHMTLSDNSCYRYLSLCDFYDKLDESFQFHLNHAKYNRETT